ncbi:ABC transporter substrate-binding protein [Bradyrhizobium sp. U87765 SZCCT0131]|uniref:ABC transporter substrate-binding protein n=1 Tax=unclassified Bradyrhizobium TaxID=2631580 RepID=UPI001BA621E7|nr:MULTISPECIES: ABC transporter substrate-binding protein [unclassified Bradyrhizobium]MBR1222997.1 ABC transporter substrate-binding protein [Bradyrhizobium sp. U87765 SZCCT0131]MBR1262733.1 ABC transporter substrate-binding protein [Bradyrhizobium sp. U87765 SZCCT0134]MBR1308795.1 ABC transporter substrate-binding protein [Bradyrhizobium sp. U87765 SZCCT0110]MBR1318515.1 ABC transporter substrate-binding protein [Bradyrhizobium sp. U87765 SZCCT0109]MBR1352219.1 ABC transporter substrate-bin
MAARALPAFAATNLSGVTLRIGDQVGQQQSKLRAAGLLDDVPYKIEWSVYPAAVNLHEALKADAVDIGAANDSPTVTAIANGSKVQVVAAWDNGGLGTSLLVPRNSPAQTVADLRGRTISPTTRGSVAHYLVVGALRQAGVGLDEVKLAFMNPVDAGAAFQSGAIDAWATWSIYVARARGQLGARILSDGAGINSGLFVYSATPSALADPLRKLAMVDFFQRVERGYVWSRNEKAKHVAWAKAFTRQDDAIAEALYVEDSSYRRIAVDDALVARLRRTFETWTSIGVLQGDIDFGGRIVRDFPVG